MVYFLSEKNRTQSVNVSVNVFQSEKGFLQFGVPQGSVLGLVLFTMYTQPLVHVMRKFNIHYQLYAKYSQLYGSIFPNKLPDLINRFEHCTAEVKTCMKISHFLCIFLFCSHGVFLGAKSVNLQLR